MNLVSDEEAISILLDGGVGVMPTDTLYGLVARAVDEKAVARMHKLKLRERKPGTVIAANTDQLLDLNLPSDDILAVERFWPAPLSVIIKPRNNLLPHLHQGLGDFPVRIPADSKLQALLLRTGPLVTTSANLSGEEPAATAKEAYNIFGDTVDFYVDGGDLSARQPSTIIRIYKGRLEMIREGAFAVPPEVFAEQ